MSIIIWALLIVFFAPVDGAPTGSSYRLNTFTTKEECQQERDRVGFQMAEAYPHERDFEIICKPLSKTVEENKPQKKDKLAVSEAAAQGQLPAPMRALLSHWLAKMYPANDEVRLIVLKAQRVYGTEHGTVMFAVRIQEQEEIKQDFLVFISQNKIVGWTTAQFPRETPIYEESTEKNA